MSTRTKSLGGVRTTNAAAYHDLGTVPAGKIWLVKSVLAYAPAATELFLGAQRGGQAWDVVRWALAANASIPPSESSVWLVLVAGDHLRVYATAANATVLVSGAELVAPV